LHEALADWSDFYVALAGASAALLGLLFVALSLRLNLFSRPEVADVRAFAVLTFGHFLVLVIIALLGLAPSTSARGLGLSLGALGLLGAGWLGYLAWLSYRLRAASEHVEWWRWAFFATILATYSGLVAVGAALLGGHLGALDWLLAVVIALLVLGAVGAWVLLSHAQPA
jgi:hypothetical protein